MGWRDWIPGVPDEDDEPVRYNTDRVKRLLRGLMGATPTASIVARTSPMGVTNSVVRSAARRSSPVPRSFSRGPASTLPRRTGGGSFAPRPGARPEPNPYANPYASKIAAPVDDIGSMFPDIPQDSGGMQFDDSAFQSQLAEIEAQRNALQGRYSQNDQSLDRMYQALARKIAEDAGGIGQNFDQTTQGVNTSSDAVNASVTGRFDETRNQNAEMMKAMGIEQAAPNVFAEGAQDSSEINGIIDANQLATTNQLAAQKAAALRQNNEFVNLAGLEGKQARGGLLQQFMDQMQGFDSQRGEVQSSLSQARQAAEQSASDPWKRYGAEWDQFTYANDALADQERSQAEMMANMPQPEQGETPDFDRIYQTAAQMLGPREAKNAMDRVARASMEPGAMEDIGAFLAAVGRSNRDRAIPYDLLRSLASQYYQAFD